MAIRRSLIVFCAAALVGIAAGIITGRIAGAGPQVDTPRRGGTFRISHGSALSNLLPWEIHPGTISSIMPAVETLVMVDRGGRVHPKLAERWEVARDLSSVTLYLRRGVRFHDGAEFNAEAVKWNLDKHLEAGLLPTVRAVRVLGPYTVRLELREWDNRIFSLLSLRQGLIISPQSYERHGAGWAQWHPVGTGPFIAVRYERTQGAMYRRFSGYWNRGKPYVDAIEFPFITDQLTLRSAFLAGRLDFVFIGPRYGHDLPRQGYPSIPAWGSMYTFIPDSANPNSPFADRRVRQAVWMALDREAIARALGFGLMEAAYQAAWPETDAYIDQLDTPRYDPDRARQLLIESGYTGGLTIKLFVETLVDTDLLALIQQQLAHAGIRIEFERVPRFRFNEAIYRGWNGLMLYPLVIRGNYNDWIGTYWMTFPFPSWRRPALLQTAFEESRKTRVLERVKLKRLNRILISDYDLIPIVYIKNLYVLQPYVRNTGHGKWHYGSLWTPAEVWLNR